MSTESFPSPAPTTVASAPAVSFTNGVVLQAGEATGDVNEAALRRIQIREAVKAHFEKEQMLFNQQIRHINIQNAEGSEEFLQLMKNDDSVKFEIGKFNLINDNEMELYGKKEKLLEGFAKVWNF